MRGSSSLLPKLFFGLALILITASAIGIIWASLMPQIEPVRVTTDQFKMDPESGYHRLKIPRQMEKWRERGMSPKLYWEDGEPIVVAKNSSAFREMTESASRITSSNVLINQSVTNRLATTQDALILAIDFKQFIQYWIRPALIGTFLLLSLWGLSFFKSTGQTTTTARMAEFDSLRGIAAFGVALMHSTVSFFPAEWFSVIIENGRLQRAPALVEWIKFSPVATLLNGSMMVSIFWILSGLVLTLPFMRKLDYEKLSQAAVKRYFRLMPLAFFTTLLSFVLLETHALWHKDYIEATGYPTGLLAVRFAGDPSAIDALWDSLFFGDNYNGPLWTIGLEF